MQKNVSKMNLRYLVFLLLSFFCFLYAENSTLFIDNSGSDGKPSMPNLNIHASALAHNKDAVLEFDSSSESDLRKHKDNISFKHTDEENTVSEDFIWNINNQLGGKIFGGKVSIKAYLKGKEIHSANLLIRGKNPTAAQVRKYIKDNCGTHWYAWAIAQHESRQHFNVFNQFNTEIYVKISGTPNHGAPDGWGIMQVDSKRGSEITTDEVYNWQTNVLSGIKVMDGAKREAQAYFNAVKRTFPDKWEEPPASFTPHNCKTKLSALDAAVIQMYNGAAVVRRLKTTFGTYTYYRSAWQFDENAPKGSRWSFKVNNHDYVYKVIHNELEGNLKSND